MATGPRPTRPGPPPESATLTIATDARLGRHLVDGSGRSLYYFANDVPAGGPQAAVSSCNADCLPSGPSSTRTARSRRGSTPRTSAGSPATTGARRRRTRGSRSTTTRATWRRATPTARGWTGSGSSCTTRATRSRCSTRRTSRRAISPTVPVAPCTPSPETPSVRRRRRRSPPARATRARRAGPSSRRARSPCRATSSRAISPSSRVRTARSSRRTKGHPLYHYVGDTAPGQTNGRAIPGWQTIDPSSP